MIEHLVAILESVLGAGKRVGSDEYYYTCPFCHHHKPKLAVNLRKRVWHCWVCNVKGRTLLSLFSRLNVNTHQKKQLRDALGDELPAFEQEDKSEHVIKLPAEYERLDPARHTEAWAYLAGRGITETDCLRYQMGVCLTGRYANRIIIPSFDKNGQVNYFVARTYRTGPINYLNPPLSKNVVAFESLLNTRYPITVVEGMLDAVAVRRNALPLLGKVLSPAVKTALAKSEATEYYVALDADARDSTLSVIEYLLSLGKTVWWVNLGSKDPSCLGFEKFQSALRNASQITPADFLKLKIRFA